MYLYFVHKECQVCWLQRFRVKKTILSMNLLCIQESDCFARSRLLSSRTHEHQPLEFKPSSVPYSLKQLFFPHPLKVCQKYGGLKNNGMEAVECRAVAIKCVSVPCSDTGTCNLVLCPLHLKTLSFFSPFLSTSSVFLAYYPIFLQVWKIGPHNWPKLSRQYRTRRQNKTSMGSW